jgi:hypothetical protein
MSVRPYEWNNSAVIGRIFMETSSIFRKSVKKVSLNSTRIVGALHEDRCAVMITSPSVLLRMGNVAE